MRIKVDNNKLDDVCKNYGLDSSKALYYTNIVVIPGQDNLYVTLDKNCNVIDVREYDNKYGNMYNYFEGVYSIFNDDIISNLELDLEGEFDAAISLGTIIKITNKFSNTFGGSLNEDFSEEYKELINYFTLIRCVMNRYFLNFYKYKCYGYKYDHLEKYMRSVIDGINSFADLCIKFNIMLDVDHMVDALSIKREHLEDAIYLIIKCKGYKKSLKDEHWIISIHEDEEYIELDQLISQMKDIVSEEKSDNKPIQKKKGRKKKK